MNFTSLPLLLGLLIAIPVAYIVPARLKCTWLLLLSYLFYCSWNAHYALLMAAATIVTYAAALLISGTSSDASKRLVLTGAIVLLLSTLVFFKYSIVLGALARLLSLERADAFLMAVVIPIGISYYLFKSISYLLDVYWGNVEATRDLVALGTYVAFFPQILSGPIQRAPEYFEQIKSPNFCTLQPETFTRALGLILLGFFEKLVIADHIGALIQAIDAAPDKSSLSILASTYGYALQLFSDFSGVTHIAIGMGLFFGIEGPPNFNRPFRANNIQEYWRGWHMSLTSWLTDYLFMPLRIALRDYGNVGLSLAIMINMVLIGVWHGANWTYLAFGIIHGCFMIVSALSLKRRNGFFKRHPWLARLRLVYAPFVTFNMVCLALAFFRAPSLTDALQALQGIGALHGGPILPHAIGRDVYVPGLLACVIAIDFATGYFGLMAFGARIFAGPIESNRRWIGYAVATILITLLAATSGGGFIYARF